MEGKVSLLLLLTAFIPVGAQADRNLDISGRLIVDAIGASFVDENDVRSSDNDLYVRQAKLELESDLTDWLKVNASAKYDQYEESEVADLFLEFKPLKDWSLVAGQFKEPAGMEKMQSLGSQFFNERSLATNVFSTSRKPGIKIEYDGKWAWVQAAYMQADSRSGYFDSGNVYAARVAIRPYRDKSKDAFVHLGGFYSTRDEVELRYDIDEPLIARSFGNSFHSPNYYADRIDTGGVEIAASFRRIVFQAEFFMQELYERDGDEWQQDGYYATLSWTAFGKPRKYRNAKIRYNDKNDSAFELSARISEADTVNFGEGDRATVLSIAANYYSWKYYKLTLEYESAELDGFDAGLTETLSGNSVALRLNASF
ncbi:MAG: OprO/OprP family phosphate-selective porin [Gammaproteobacteria bacterium]|nr:OprO/OprP family phosphate-selective porin [Gammaproteobacteria bacterium]